jgi:membrane-bound lytic murein transglycosylase D
VPTGGAISSSVARRMAEPAEAAVRIHRVRSGETLSGLAQRYGVSVRALRAANGLSSRATLRAGAKLKIPG